MALDVFGQKQEEKKPLAKFSEVTEQLTHDLDSLVQSPTPDVYAECKAHFDDFNATYPTLPSNATLMLASQYQQIVIQFNQISGYLTGGNVQLFTSLAPTITGMMKAVLNAMSVAAKNLLKEEEK